MSETFPENEVGVIRDYVGAAGADPAGRIDSITAGLNLVFPGGHGIEEHNPFPPHNEINEDATKRRHARLRVENFLGSLKTILAALEDVYLNVGKQEYGLADSGLAAIPTFGPAMTASDISEAFATGPVFYVFISGTPTEPDSQDFALPGYPGPAVDAQELLAAAQLVAGGPERDAQLGFLKAEIDFGKRDLQSLVQAIQAYARLLPAATTTPLDLFGVHLDLFADFFWPLGIQFGLTPRQKFVAIRSAFAHLAVADQFFRSQRALNDDQRQGITGVYDTAVRLVQQSGVSADNPRRQEVEAVANQQKAKLQANLNFLGLWDAFVPVQRFSQLEQDATLQIDAARESATRFQDFLDKGETAAEQQKDVQLQQEQEQTNLQILSLQQQNATLGVNKIDEQLSAIDDQRTAQEGDLGSGLFKAVLDGVTTGLTTKEPALGILTAGLGITSTLMHSSAQDEELAHQQRMAGIEREIAVNQGVIVDLEQAMSQQRLAFYTQKLAFLANKALNADLFYTLAELQEKRAERQLEAAIFLAYLYERALAFFLGEPNISHIAFDYRDRLGPGPASILDAANALKEDFQHVLQERDRVNETKFDFFEQAISLSESYPLQFSRFLQTGRMDFDYSLYEFSKLRPATHQCRLREVGVEIKALVPVTGFSGTLTHRGRFLVRDRSATLTDPAATRLVPTEAQLAQALEDQRRHGLPVAAVGGVLLYDLDADTKELSQDTQFVSHAPPTQTTLNVFEGHGPNGLWHLEIQDFGQLGISDILLHFAIVSRESDVDALEPKVEDLIRKYESELSGGQALDRISGFSLRQDFPDTFFGLQTGPTVLNLGPSNFPTGLGKLRFKLVIAQALDAHGKGVPGVSLEIARQDAGFDQVRVTRDDGFSEDLDAPPEPLAPGNSFAISGSWQIRLSDPSQFARLGDLRLFFLYAFDA